MIISKKITDNTPDGVIKLFQLPDDYVSGSIVIFEIKSNKTVLMHDFTELGGPYIELVNAPEINSKLLILYDFNDESIELASQTIEGFKPWDSKRLLDLAEQMIILSKTVEQLKNSLKSKVTKEEMQSFVGPLYDEIKKLNIAHQVYGS